MFEEIIKWDKLLFYYINSEWVNELCDFLMPLLRNKFIWAPLYLFIIIFFLRNYKLHGVYVLIYLAIVILFCDQLSANLKEVIQRLRPCQDVFWTDHLRLLAGCGKPFGFPSNHAANHFGVATFFSVLMWNNSRLVLPLGFLWAGIIGYAQVYVGVHYPLDVAGGALLGIFIGVAIAMLLKRHIR